MSEMVERVARGLAEVAAKRFQERGPSTFAEAFPGGVPEYVEWRHHLYVDDARAAIAAMREPTEGMCEAGDNAVNCSVTEASSYWRAMIDAATR